VPGKPKILVVLPTLGTRLDFLRKALESVEQQRTSVDLTLALVFPEGQTEVQRLAEVFGAKVVPDPGRGMSAAMNAGRSVRTTEEFTIWLGDDDSYRPSGLAKLLGLMEEHPETVVAYGACDYVDSSGRVLWTNASGKIARFLLPWGPNLIPHPAAMIRIDDLEEIGGYDENLRLVMDLDVFLKLRKRGTFQASQVPVASFGWHADSLTVSNRLASEAEARMVKRQHLPVLARAFSWIWELPVAVASRIAAKRLDGRHRGA
jgi:hypothetical protein